MKEYIVNQQMHISVPDDFREFSQEEMNALYRDDNSSRWGVKSEEKHVSLVIFYHKSNALLASLTNVKDLANNIRKKYDSMGRDHNYEMKGTFEDTIAALDAAGFDYAYDVGGIRQAGRITVVKKKGMCYTLYYYAREPLSAEAIETWKNLTDSITID